jgi:hypothetical protein
MKLDTVRINKLVNQYNNGRQFPADAERFEEHASRYIKAIKEGRMICSIGSVSASGMSRTIKFLEMAKCSKPYRKPYVLLNFYEFFQMIGYAVVKDSDYFRIHGCGMDMVFNTNYSIIQLLHLLGFINRKTCEELAQQTPSVI